MCVCVFFSPETPLHYKTNDLVTDVLTVTSACQVLIHFIQVITHSYFAVYDKKEVHCCGSHKAIQDPPRSNIQRIIAV